MLRSTVHDKRCNPNALQLLSTVKDCKVTLNNPELNRLTTHISMHREPVPHRHPIWLSKFETAVGLIGLPSM